MAIDAMYIFPYGLHVFPVTVTAVILIYIEHFCVTQVEEVFVWICVQG